ncbi:ISAzo13-like element transposase-related protein [Bathymodiolus platifrons methanotrophic gill symbiont]|uniref:ISAzo13-like element transposase-related protein n=1 Tax=Bathymodiolus platifrons methanotrophic gill symbiont TaxID=113268 RepID=UPI0021E13A3D|nr:hypothetical protein [Bathymodiolus platifrons methanotrophic gill symbiont]
MLQQHTAGNPMNSSIRWTYLKPREIVSELLKKGYSVSRNIVRYLLKKHEYVKRKAQKNITIGAPCYLTKFRDSCRRNSFTYAANRRCSSRPASATD